MMTKRVLVHALGVALMQGACAPVAFADADWDRYATSKYEYCDAIILGAYWHQSVDDAKATIGRKLGWGNAAIVAGDLDNARNQGTYCQFDDTGLAFEDAQAVAALWGIGVSDAKAALAEKVSMGMRDLAFDVVAEAYGSEVQPQGAGPAGEIVRVDFEGSWYWLGVPAGADEPLPVVVALHGDEGHPDNMRTFWSPVWASQKNFILVAPECPRAMCDKGGVNTWSAGDVEGTVRQGAWLKAAIEDIASKHPVDIERIHAVGYSGGSIFLGLQGFKMFGDIFASIQWFCGGVNQTEDEVYIPPANPACKVPGRLVISRSGDKNYLVTAADRIEEILKNNGHFVEFLDTGCSGHCCNAESLSQNAWDWAQQRPVKCGSDLGLSYHAVDDTPNQRTSEKVRVGRNPPTTN